MIQPVLRSEPRTFAGDEGQRLHWDPARMLGWKFLPRIMGYTLVEKRYLNGGKPNGETPLKWSTNGGFSTFHHLFHLYIYIHTVHKVYLTNPPGRCYGVRWDITLWSFGGVLKVIGIQVIIHMGTRLLLPSDLAVRLLYTLYAPFTVIKIYDCR